MDKELQSRIWQCLPKEAREEIKKDYKSHPSAYHPYFNEGYGEALKIYFGKHNLTSNTEPSEFICVERVKVDALQSEIFKEIMDAHDAEDWQSVAHYVLDVLPRSFHAIFGDKCLPDKEPSAQVEPKYKFSLGQKVILHFHGGEKGTISERLPPQEGNVWNCYKVKELPYHLWRENELDPYTEPEAKPLRVGDKVKVKGEDKVREVYRILPDGRIMFGDKGNFYSLKDLELVEPETKDNMGEKELGKEDNFPTKEINRKALYDAMYELEIASIKVRKALIRYEVEITD